MGAPAGRLDASAKAFPRTWIRVAKEMGGGGVIGEEEAGVLGR